MIKILVKMVNWVGDTLLTTPTLRALRRGCRGAEISVVARPWVSGVLENNPDIDRLIVADEKESPLAYWRLVSKLRAEKFDLGISLPNSFSAAFLLWSSRVTKRVGYALDGRSFLLTHPVKVKPEILKMHQVEYYLNLLNGLCDVKGAERKLVLEVSDEDRRGVDELLEERGLSRNRLLVGMAPGATYGSAKRWHADRFAKVADYLADTYQAEIFAMGSAKESAIAAEVQKNSRVELRDLTGKIGLRAMAALMERLALFVCNDSGAMHVAAALDVPLVAIFGSTDWVTTAPCSKEATIVRKEIECAPCLERECPLKHHNCMEWVSVADVLEAVDQQLERQRTVR
ncbi:MAG: lipopolysaccharide heptosyltransferase II [bacterium]